MRWNHIRPVVFVLVVGLFSTLVAGQEIRDLTEREVTPDLLIEALAPSEPPPEELAATRGARSLRAQASCAFYRSQLSRGLTVRPVADVVRLSILFDFDSYAISQESPRRLPHRARP